MIKQCIMENTSEKDLLSQAKNNLMENMLGRGIGAIIWDNASAGFHYLPMATTPNGVVNVSGIYVYDDVLYLLDEKNPKANMDLYYNKDTEVRPSIICLSPNVAPDYLGDPRSESGFTTEASMEEWLAIADCYFEALGEK